MTKARQPIRVCLLSSSHPVDYSRFFDREAVSLARGGYDVTIVGVGSSDSEQTRRGVRLVSRRLRHGLGKFPLLRRLEREASNSGYGVCHCLDPWTLSIGLRLKAKRPEIRVVYEASEWFPQTYLDRRDLPGPLRRMAGGVVSQLERQACRHADLVIETNRTRATRFIRQGCEPVLVPNYPPLELLPEVGGERKPWIAWTGLMSRPRGFHKLLEALVLVRDRHPEVQLQVAGKFDPRDDIESWSRTHIAEYGLEGNVVLHGTLAYDATLAMLGQCLVGVILLQPERGNDYTGQPNKLFEFMGAGLSIVASDFPEIGPVVCKHSCGSLVNPTDPGAIAAALSDALARPGLSREQGVAGRRAVVESYNWAEAERSLLDAYERMTG